LRFSSAYGFNPGIIDSEAATFYDVRNKVAVTEEAYESAKRQLQQAKAGDGIKGG
jgi:hypothetical protein